MRRSVTHTGCVRSRVLWDELLPVGVASWEPYLVETTVMCCFQETGLYEYKVFGVLTSCSPELVADVYMDLAFRKEWDKYAKGNKNKQKE